MALRFRKKPVVIEAMNWDGTAEEATAVIEWVLATGTRSVRYHEHAVSNDNMPWLAIDTLEGTMAASPGDWIIRGVSNEHYPCKPGIFEATYEAVD